MEKPTYTAIDYNSHENRVIEERLRDYYLPVKQLDMNNIERYFDDYGEVKRWWIRDLQIWYVFFYEKKGYKTRGVLGKDRTKDLLRSIL